MPQNLKILFLLFCILFSAPGVLSAADEDSPRWNDTETATRPTGIGALFLKKQEVMTRNNWQSPPLDAFVAYRDLSLYDAIWCAQLISKYNRPAWRILRRNRPEQLMLYYISGVTSDADGGFTYLDYNYINSKHPEWFLLADNREAKPADYMRHEKRIRWNYSDQQHSYYNRFYLDVANKDFQRWAANQILELVSDSKGGSGFRYDGVAIDNVYVDKRLHNRLRFKYPRWKYANDVEAWSKGYIDYLKEIKKVLSQHGFILAINYNPVGNDRRENESLWTTLYGIADCIMSEQSLRSGWTKSSYFTGDKWLAAIERHEQIIENGVMDWWACHPEEKDRRGDDVFMYTYCSWLLIKRPGKSFYSLHATDSALQKSCWYDEYDLPIGDATSKRYLKDSCWIRDYENSKIIVNPTNKSQSIAMDTGKLWLDWSSKKPISEIELPPRSGRILLPTPYKVESF